MTDVLRKITAARTRLILDKPFLGALVLRLPLKEVRAPWCPTTATDARHLYYNPEFIKPLNISQVQFVLAHDALHCGLSHFARREHRERHRWDVACDHAVNQLLKEDSLQAPAGSLSNDDYAGMSAEEIYPFIPSDTEEEPLDQHLYDTNSDYDAKEQKQQADHSGNNADDQSNGQDDSAGQDPPPPLSLQEREHLKTQWQQRLAGAAQQAAQAGKMNGSVARLVERLLASSVPWRAVLARHMSSSARVDYNLTRPSRRREGDAIMPSLHARQINVVVALDTSGSIEDDELNEFVAELNAIKCLVNARITLMACDSQLDENGPWVYESWEPLRMPETLKGHGGTDFSPVFDRINNDKLHPDLIVYFTDARGRFPKQLPVTETLWLVKGSANVPWGQRIQLN